MTSPLRLDTRAQLAAARATAADPVAVVMTMGALHEGHDALLHAARDRAGAGTVIATVFVNPLQFGPGEDFQRYPRTLESDLARCRAAGVDLAFTPAPDEMYPHGEPLVRVDPGPWGTVLEGASRPGHFAGVLTVVYKLLQATRPAVACFGEKDYQQLSLIRAMARDLDLPVEVVSVPTVREPDGLALSSRNRYLSPAQRRAAAGVPATLRAGADAAARGASPEQVLTAATQTLSATPEVKLDYLALTDPDLRPLAEPVGTALAPLAPVPADGVARLLIAAWVGSTRLIDNIEILLPRGDE
ncbi:pantoate--beta-alanine ligase [Natronosporangium hydrolyticum]|uniref:Pantothenate synthetase n=1 Tax=Natronosporangium hydrolyticum TaxID=2811111 RepID=A0A895YMC6_9ACTN|nr:pantoate--beta-alanine ligase [Natronosporangium hydrolyticum]QSB15048.1 pantoate--beta-alanine ligase [Natronosporangium hydrolyticum]